MLSLVFQIFLVFRVCCFQYFYLSKVNSILIDVFYLLKDFDLDYFNMIDMKAKKVLESLYEMNEGEFLKGEQIHRKTSLLLGK